MRVCSICSARNGDWARRCAHCLGPIDARALCDPRMPEGALTVTAEFAVFGGILMVIGPFLPFAEWGEFAANGLLKTGMSSLPVICAGAIVAVFGLLSLVLRRRYATWYLPCAVAAAGMTFYHQLAVENQFARVHAYSSDLGLGIHFCYLGALFSLIAAGVSVARLPATSLKARLAGVASLAETSFRRRPVSMTFEEIRERKRRRR